MRDIPPEALKSTSARRAWVKAELLRLYGVRLSDVARRLSVSPNSVYLTFDRPAARIEAEIANLLDVDPKSLFPERYAANGERIHSVRGRPEAVASMAA